MIREYSIKSLQQCSLEGSPVLAAHHPAHVSAKSDKRALGRAQRYDSAQLSCETAAVGAVLLLAAQ